MKYKFAYFQGFVRGWWLVLSHGDNLEKLGLDHNLSSDTIQAIINGGGKVCMNVAGGFHRLTDQHNAIATYETDSLKQWPSIDPIKAVLTDRDTAKEKGYAVFNNGPHFCVDIPEGPSTVTLRTKDGKLLTVAFSVYEEGECPTAANVQYHYVAYEDIPSKFDVDIGNGMKARTALITIPLD